MNDLISRQAAIDALEVTPFDDYGDYMRARELIEQLPSAQTEIVRCKDCKRKNAIIEIGMGSGKRIEVLCGVFNIITQSDDYCSYGERKEDNER